MFQTEKEQAEFMQAEYDLFAPTFKDNKPMLKVLRKVLLGIDVTPAEREMFRLIPASIIDRISTYLLPTVTGDEGLQLVNDFWLQFNLKERSEFQVKLDIQFLPLVLNFFEGSIQRLNGNKGDLAISDIGYSKTKTADENIMSVIARNTILATVEGLLTTIHHKANSKPMTEDEIKSKAKANSSR